MARYWYRTHGVTSVHVAAVGPNHFHDTIVIDPFGLPRLVIDDCAVCEPYLHAADWSNRPADIVRTFDEEQDFIATQDREKRLGPEIAEIVARVVGEMHARRERPTEDGVTAAVREYLAANPAALAVPPDNRPAASEPASG